MRVRERPQEPESIGFWSWVVTPRLTLCQEYKRGKLYSFVNALAANLCKCEKCTVTASRASRRVGAPLKTEQLFCSQCITRRQFFDSPASRAPCTDRSLGGDYRFHNVFPSRSRFAPGTKKALGEGASQ